MISLRSRITWTYIAYICIAAIVLSVLSNSLADKLFSSYVKNNLATKNDEIIISLSEQYDLMRKQFNVPTVEIIGMTYLHQGFVLYVYDADENLIWDARACDVDRCEEILDAIKTRTETHSLSGKVELSSQSYPIKKGGQYIGRVVIESFGPIFYTENQSDFLHSLNGFIMAIGLAFALLSIAISIFVASKISKPILQAVSATKRIVQGDLSVRVPEEKKAKELYQLAQSVNGLAMALENGEKWQKRLTSDIAHELRTPITTLQGNLEAMMDGVMEPTVERLSICHEEILRLSTLVEDLNQLSILERGDLNVHKRETELGAIVAKVVQSFQEVAEAKGVSLDLEAIEAPMIADPERLTQVFVNLISNALKYTDAGAVKAIVTEAGESAYLVTISDTGMGIDCSDLPRIFDRFYRSDQSRNRTTGGAGIGLTITSAIVAAHGGEIRVESQLGVGSHFHVKLPKTPLQPDTF